MIPYITYNDMIKDINENIWKIPKDIDGVIAVPRSGVIPAIIIAMYFHIPLTTVDIFLNSKAPYEAFTSFGGGLRFYQTIKKDKELKKFLVIDDTYASGNSMKKTKEKLKNFNYDFVYSSMYLEGKKEDGILCLKDLSDLKSISKIGFNLYEWNIFCHFLEHKFLFDIDGFIFYEPPLDTNIEKYEAYIKNPILKHKVIDTGNLPIDFLTYRLVKYQKETIESLVSNGINVGKIYMYNAQTIEERNKIPSYLFKASFYKSHDEYLLYVESDDYQAKMIHNISGKPVFSVEKNCIYN